MMDDSDSDICDSFKPSSLKIVPKDHFKKERDDFQNQLKQIKIMDVEMDVPDKNQTKAQQEKLQNKTDQQQPITSIVVQEVKAE